MIGCIFIIFIIFCQPMPNTLLYYSSRLVGIFLATYSKFL